MKKPVFLVLAGDGINCERETAQAFVQAGGDARVIHINDLVDHPAQMETVDGLAIPGGFSFGDELGSGQIMALKIRHGLGDYFRNFIAARKPVIGICNGFQVLVKLGLLPDMEAAERQMALAQNDHGSFINRWVTLDRDVASVCRWTAGMTRFELPIRHGEGRIVFKDDDVYKELVRHGQIALRYTEDVNGSYDRIAGVCDKSGLVLGLMPHPEAHAYRATYLLPETDYMRAGDGIALFRNIIQYLQQQETHHVRKAS